MEKIAGMTKDIIRGVDISTYQSLINAAPQAKIALQLETPNIYKYRTIMTVFKNNGINYDYLGTSYYPFWSTGNSNGTYKGQDLGKGAKYGDPINVYISAALKWVKNL